MVSKEVFTLFTLFTNQQLWVISWLICNVWEMGVCSNLPFFEYYSQDYRNQGQFQIASYSLASFITSTNCSWQICTGCRRLPNHVCMALLMVCCWIQHHSLWHCVLAASEDLNPGSRCRESKALPLSYFALQRVRFEWSWELDIAFTLLSRRGEKGIHSNEW